jgi:hypothetical protein
LDPDKLLEAVTALIDGMRADMAKLGEKCDSIGAKYDALTKRKDGDDSTMAEPVAADRADSVRLRADVDYVQAALRDLQIKQPRKRSDADRNEFASVQARADVAYRAWNERADQPMQGEELIDYTIRLHRGLQRHAPKSKWAKTELATIARDSSTLATVCDSIRADAFEAANSPVDMNPFQHRMIEETLPSGHVSRRFIGQGTCFAMQSAPARRVLGIGAKQQGVTHSAGGAIYSH